MTLIPHLSTVEHLSNDTVDSPKLDVNIDSDSNLVIREDPKEANETELLKSRQNLREENGLRENSVGNRSPTLDRRVEIATLGRLVEIATKLEHAFVKCFKAF